MPRVETCSVEYGEGETPPRIVTVLSEEVRDIQRANIRACLERKLPQFEPDQRPRPALHIVGGGHSAQQTLGEIDGDVCAVNGAHDWLIGKGIVPDYTLFLDWTQEVAERFSPRREVVYLAASTCHPRMWDRLDGFDVRVWHTGVAKDFLPVGTLVYGGGPCATQRIIPVLYEWGYREFHFHGVDACIREQSHVYPWKTVGRSGAVPVTVRCAGREFRTWLAFLAQAQSFHDFLDIYDRWAEQGVMDPITILVHGDGLIPHIARMNNIHFHSVREPTYSGRPKRMTMGLAHRPA